jgi:hypothetical protein
MKAKRALLSSSFPIITVENKAVAARPAFFKLSRIRLPRLFPFRIRGLSSASTGRNRLQVDVAGQGE